MLLSFVGHHTPKQGHCRTEFRLVHLKCSSALEDNPKRKTYFFWALIFAHLAFWATLILVIPTALIFRLVLVVLLGRLLPLTLAQRALAATEIFFRAVALILRCLRSVLRDKSSVVTARIRMRLFCRVSIRFLIFMACLSCLIERFVRVFMPAVKESPVVKSIC